jgi:outer membrane lipopolysaccharide assembly protein LptE/RlpB
VVDADESIAIASSPFRLAPCYLADVRRLLLLPLFLTVVGCGYHLVGTATYLPPEIQRLHVEFFENQTSRGDMDQRVAEALNLEWVRRGRFELVDRAEDADIVLGGTMTRLSVVPVSFDESGRATEYQMTLLTEVWLNDVRGEDPVLLWENKSFSRRTSYAVDEDSVDYFDRQRAAMDELSTDYARALVSAVLEGF